MKIWYPFTQHALEPEPIKIVRGEGASVFDDQGNAYLDLISSWWVNMHGHAHPWIARKISEQAHQLEHIVFSNFTHDPAIQLSKKLEALLPPYYEYMFFSDNGSTSVEVALKMLLGRASSVKRKILALEGAYHGDTFGAMSVSARGGFTDKFQKELFDVEFLPFPSPGNESTTIHVLKEKLKDPHSYVAFICEPLIQGSAGMRMYAPEILSEMIFLLKEAGCAIIFDEVFTGFGRTGKMFAFEHLEERFYPDLICLSKGLTGGFLPLGITLCPQKIFDFYYSTKREDAFFHGHSYTANPLSCSAAVANLEVFEKEKTLVKIKKIELLFKNYVIHSPLNKNGFKLESTGAVLSIKPLNQGESNKNYFSEHTLKLKKLFLNEGLLLRPLGDTVYLVPPYCISKSDLENAFIKIEKILLEKALF